MNAGHAKHVSPRSRPVNALLAGVPSTAERVSDTEFEERPTRPAREEGEMVIPGTYVRDWVKARELEGNPVPKNRLDRYDKHFEPAALCELLQLDPAFDVQGQWFAAASYGLMQIIPESLRTRVEGSAFDSAGRAAILAIYNPKTNTPEWLFHPETCIELGAVMDSTAVVAAERGDPLVLLRDREGTPIAYEETCPLDWPSQCSWQRLWKRRFRVYNTGSETGNDGGTGVGGYVAGGYANDVIQNSGFYVPQQ
jgi:hypothetical protein